MLIRIPGCLAPEQAAAIAARLRETDAWVDGRVTAGFQGEPVKRNQQVDEHSPLARELGDAVLSALERDPVFISAALPARVYPPMFNRYEPGMQFGAHVDGAIRLIPGTGIKLRTDVSATLFLAPKDSYDGGELLVEDTYGTHSVKLDAGD
ncbi:MAG TPA: Fe2+-dependent dioxygenase, partial [Rhodanobacteraceae bacterium]|nr:Fe2+-dependent dioxygenase [Rhodanobacteraceae bacterium]